MSARSKAHHIALGLEIVELSVVGRAARPRLDTDIRSLGVREMPKADIFHIRIINTYASLTARGQRKTAAGIVQKNGVMIEQRVFERQHTPILQRICTLLVSYIAALAVYKLMYVLTRFGKFKTVIREALTILKRQIKARMTAECKYQLVITHIVKLIYGAERAAVKNISDTQAKIERIAFPCFRICSKLEARSIAALLYACKDRVACKAVQTDIIRAALICLPSLCDPAAYREQIICSARPILRIALPKIFKAVGLVLYRIQLRADIVYLDSESVIFNRIQHSVLRFSAYRLFIARKLYHMDEKYAIHVLNLPI